MVVSQPRRGEILVTFKVSERSGAREREPRRYLERTVRPPQPLPLG